MMEIEVGGQHIKSYYFTWTKIIFYDISKNLDIDDYRLRAVPLREIDHWLDPDRQYWPERLYELEQF